MPSSKQSSETLRSRNAHIELPAEAEAVMGWIQVRLTPAKLFGEEGTGTVVQARVRPIDCPQRSTDDTCELVHDSR